MSSSRPEPAPTSRSSQEVLRRRRQRGHGRRSRYFGRGRMVPEFDAIVFTMETGQVNDLVKAQYGFHIIKLMDKKVGTTRSLDEVRGPSPSGCQWSGRRHRLPIWPSRCSGRSRRRRMSIPWRKRRASRLRKAGSSRAMSDPRLRSVAGAREAGLRDEPRRRGGPDSNGARFVFLTLVAKQDPYIPKLEEAKDRVRDDVIEQRAREFGRKKAIQVAATLRRAADFQEGRQICRLRVANDRAHHARFADPGARRRHGGDRGGLHAAAGRRPAIRFQRTWAPPSSRCSKSRSDSVRSRHQQRTFPGGTLDRSTQSLLRRLHGEGQAEDAD